MAILGGMDQREKMETNSTYCAMADLKVMYCPRQFFKGYCPRHFIELLLGTIVLMLKLTNLYQLLAARG
uniref:Uncharacterized protein n=1 Tax=Arundo donax TaxID=35708 RepID=A0A0A9FNK9_ARUDO